MQNFSSASEELLCLAVESLLTFCINILLLLKRLHLPSLQSEKQVNTLTLSG